MKLPRLIGFGFGAAVPNGPRPSARERHTDGRGRTFRGLFSDSVHVEDVHFRKNPLGSPAFATVMSAEPESYLLYQVPPESYSPSEWPDSSYMKRVVPAVPDF